MKKLKLIFSVCLLFTFLSEANASYRETDFSPFPLNLGAEDLLSGYWKSNDDFLQILEIRNDTINEHSWFIIYRVSADNPEDRSVDGFIYYDSIDDIYKRLTWTAEGIEVTPFVLFMLQEPDDDTKSVDDEKYCVTTSIYMLKIYGQMFIRTECDI